MRFSAEAPASEPTDLLRERLVRRLLDDRAPPVGLVVAPAGAGKTVLLRQVASRVTAPSCWLRLTEAEREPSALLARIDEGLRRAVAARGRTPYEPASSVSPSDLRTWLDSLHPGRVWLFVDDLHGIVGSPAEALLHQLVENRSQTLRIVLAGRTAPASGTARLLVSGVLDRLRAADLAFRSWEVVDLFRKVHREPLPSPAAALLTARLDGWAAGLQLFQMQTSGRTPAERERAIEQLSGRNRLLRAYVDEEWLQGIDPGTRAFLLLTSTLGTLTGDLCDALLGTVGSGRGLDELATRLQLVATEDDGRTFRQHRALQEHLRTVLEDEVGAADRRRLWFRAAQILERAGFVDDACTAFVGAHRWADASRLLATGRIAVTDASPRWLRSQAPAELVEDPGLLLTTARGLARRGSLAAALDRLDPTRFGAAASAVRHGAAAERAALLPWRRPNPTANAVLPGTDNGSGPHETPSGEVRDLLRRAQPSRAGDGALIESLAALLSGRLKEAAAAAAGASPTEFDDAVALRLVEVVADLATQPDVVTLARLERLVSDSERVGRGWLGRMAEVVRRAVLCGSPTEAETEAERLAADCRRIGDAWGELLGYGVLGLAARRMAPSEEADRLLGRARELASMLDAPVLACWAEVLGEPGTAPPPALARRAVGLGLSWTEVTAALRRTAAKAALSEPASATTSTSPGPRPLEPLALMCLGGFEIRVGDLPVDLDGLRPRHQSLLTLLALNHRRRVHREQLIDRLWPEAPFASGLRSLQVAISNIRTVLRTAGLSDVLRRSGESYVLDLGTAVEDQLVDFERSVRAADRLARSDELAPALAARLAAVELYRGDLLPEVGPAEWVVDERERLRSQAARMAVEAAELALDLADPETGLAVARRAVEIDPYQDRGWVLLATLQGRSGDETAAERTRQRHDRVRGEH